MFGYAKHDLWHTHQLGFCMGYILRCCWSKSFKERDDHFQEAVIVSPTITASNKKTTQKRSGEAPEFLD
jgi:hypothetical protein